jgi:glycosyltransferase involved in cell wall biosynthesis
LIFIIFKYNNILRDKKINYAVSFLALPNLINGIISKFNPKVKTYISERGFPTDNTTNKLSFYISKIFYPILYNQNYKLFSNSIYINKDLKNNFGVKIPMEVIYNPIETPKVTIIPYSLGIEKTCLKIITVGSLNIRKNQIMIIKAIARHKNKFSLTIGGSGDLETMLKTKSKELGLDEKVYFIGQTKDVDKYLIEHDCFVLSSFTEGFPNVLLEAMSIGLPCISTNCLSGPMELLHDNLEVEIPKNGFFKAEYGILVNNNDVEGLANALDYLKSNPNERVKYSQKSLDRAKNYELDKIYNEFKVFINN